MNTVIQDQIVNFVVNNEDACAIFSPKDFLVFCNSKFGELFCYSPSEALGKSFAELVLNAFKLGHGIRVNSTDTCIHKWIKKAQLKRRTRNFRIFEVDLVDGRWMLFSEQLDKEGYLFLHAKNITRQKILEFQLTDNVKQLSTLASIDELTKLPNRRSLIKDANRLIEKASNLNSFGLIVLDVDNFKSINDKHGHYIGDQVLKHIAFRLRNVIRPHDLIGRIGGEEFVILLQDLSFNAAVSAGERAVECINKAVFAIENLKLPITISAGLEWQKPPVSFEDLYINADGYLYNAKKNGKNQLSTFYPESQICL